MDRNNTSISQAIKDLVIARLEVLPEDTGISIGSAGEFTRDELIERVRQGDEIGQKIVQVELSYLKSLKNITKEFLNE
jgi:hypothetical protein